MNGDDSPVLLYAHPSMYLLAEEIVSMCTNISTGFSQSQGDETPSVSKRTIERTFSLSGNGLRSVLFRKTIQWNKFADGFPNLFIEDVKYMAGKDVIFIGSFHSPELIFEQLSVLFSFPRYLAKSFHFILPYFPTGTMERVDTEGQIATAKTLATLMSAIPLTAKGPAQICIFDIHALQERFYFSDNIIPRLESAVPLLLREVNKMADKDNIAFAFPDDGACKRFHHFFGGDNPITCVKIRDGNKRIVKVKDGIFQSGRWTSLAQDVNPNLHHLMEQLPAFCLASRANNTQRQYRNVFNLFCKWCLANNITQTLPALDTSVSLYLINLTNAGKSSSTMNEAFYAISWAHRLAGVIDPCGSDLVKIVKDGSIRSVGRFIVKKEPVTPEIIKQLVNVYGHLNADLKNIRVVCMCLICYAGFLRFAELANLRRHHISIFDNFVKLLLESSKTDVYREGREVLISKTNTATCPVNMLIRYLSLANFPSSSTDYIFRPLCFCKSSNTYKLRKEKLSYTTAREILLSALETLGLDKKKFGLHSLRSGGATAAAAAKVEDRLFKKHGRWKTEKAKDGYVKESISERLTVTQNIGNPENKHVIIVDDLVQTGGTLKQCGKALLEKGAKAVSAYVTHPVFPNSSWKLFVNSDVKFENFWITDSIPHARDICEHSPFRLLSLCDPIAEMLMGYDLMPC